MKDQKTLDEDLTPLEKWDRARTLMLESLYKPDNALRNCAINQGCKDDLLSIRDQVVEMVRDMPNPHTPPLPFGKKNDIITPVNDQGISKVVISGALSDYYQSLGD